MKYTPLFLLLFSALAISGCTSSEKVSSSQSASSVQSKSSAVSSSHKESSETVQNSASDSATESSEAESSPSESSEPVIVDTETQTVQSDVYDVSTVLAQADALQSQSFEIVGNLPQALVEDEQGNLIMVIYGDDGSRLHIDGDVNIGGCRAILDGTLSLDESGPVFLVESAQVVE